MNWHQFCLSKGKNYYQKFNNSCLIILESYQTPVISVDRSLEGQGHENNFTELQTFVSAWIQLNVVAMERRCAGHFMLMQICQLKWQSHFKFSLWKVYSDWAQVFEKVETC